MPAKGRCLCGQIQYDLNNSSRLLELCHCKNCQRQGGAAFIPFLAVPLADLSIDGQAKMYLDTDTVSGNAVKRYFCGACGSPLYVVVEYAPNTAYVAAGTLDDTSQLSPKGQGWVSTRQPWVKLEENIPAHPGDPGLTDA